MRCLLILMMAVFCIGQANGQSEDTLKIMTYNLLFFPNPSNNNNIGKDASRIVYFRQIIDEIDPDIIICQEMTDLSGATMLVNELNSNASTGKTYSHAPNFTEYGPSVYGIGNMLIYNDDIVDLIAQSELPRNNTANASNGNTVIAPRANSLYELQLNSTLCPSQSNNLSLISGHFKAGTDNANSSEISDRDRRNLSALDLMDYINAAASTENIISGGDFNFYGDEINGSTYSEPAYETLSQSSNTNPLVDILGGFTRNIAGDVAKYTQSTRAGGTFNPYGNDGSPGGIDDRFDFLLYTNAISNNLDNVRYLSGSYETVANPLIWNGDAMDGNSPIKNQIQWNSDHYPVVLEVISNYPTCSTCPVTQLENLDYILGEILEIEAVNLIQADNLIGPSADIEYHAGQCVEMDIGFEVQLGAVFHAYILGCTP